MSDTEFSQLNKAGAKQDYYAHFTGKNRGSGQSGFCRFHAKTLPDQWQSQILAWILEKYRVIFVTDPCNQKLVEDMHMTYTATVEEVFELALQWKGQDAQVTVIPDGVSVIVR